MSPDQHHPSFGAYLPIDRRLALARGESLPDRTEGAALFADISGFTPLSQTLDHELGARQGAEALTTYLNRVHGALIGAVRRYHGSVTSFSGDAVTCWFDRDYSVTGDVAGSVWMAATCALAIQETVRQIEAIVTPSGARIPLTIKVALTAGPVRRLQIGSPQIRFIDTLAGSTLDRLATAAELALQGEVVVDDQALEQLSDRARIIWRQAQGEEPVAVLTSLTEQAPPSTWPEAPELTPKQASQWLLPPVFRRLRRGEGEYLAELRTAVTLFVRFTGLDFDWDDAAGEKLDAYISWVQSLLIRYQGYLVNLTFGDKGSYFQISFGALLAHEDDAVRAISMALELIQPPARLNYVENVQIGVVQGPMRTGAYGASERRTYGVHGAQVNVAARLMTWAEPGQILVTEPVVDAANEIVAFERLGEFQFKGLDAPLPTFRVIGRRREVDRAMEKTGPVATIVGREAELTDLAAQLTALRQGQSGIAIIVGEAGIGKSRLVETFAARAREGGVSVLAGSGNAIERTTAFHAWRPILRQCLGRPGSDDPAAARQALTGLLTGDAFYVERAPLLNSVLSLELPDNDLTASMSGEVRLDNTGALLVHLLKMGKDAATPQILILEDAHWLDSASWALVDRVRREMETILLVIVTRPIDPAHNGEGLGDEYHALLTAPETRLYELEAMTSDEALALVYKRLGVQSLPEEIGRLIQERAEGHPLFTEEIALSLRDTGLIRVEEGRAVLTDGADLTAVDFPGTVQGVVTSRIDQLQPGQQLTLKVASVIGRVFLFRTLEAIHPIPGDRPRLPTYLETLERLEITPLEAREPELSYSFRHAIIQEVAYNLLLYTQREALHRAIATWYEKIHAADLSRWYPSLAYHWEQAGDLSKTITYLERAGRQALRNYANVEAVRFLSKALSLEEMRRKTEGRRESERDRLRRARWLRQLGQAHLALGRLPESRAALLEMLRLSNRPVPESQLRLLGGMVKQTVVQVVHRIRPARYLGRAQGAKAAAFLEVARSYQELAEIYYYANERAQTLNAGLNVLNLAEEAGPSPELARAYANMVVITGLIPWDTAAAAYKRLTLETAAQVGDLGVMAWSYLLVGTYEVGLGRWGEVEEHARQAVDLFAKQGDKRLEGLSLGLLALVPAGRGDFAESYRLYCRWYDVARDGNNIQHQAFGLFGQAENILPQGRAEEAAELAAQGVDILVTKGERSVENRTAELRGFGLLGAARLRQGDRPAAQEAAGEMLAIARELSAPSRVTVLEGLSGAAEVFVRSWEAGDSSARKRARQACKVLNSYARVFPIGRPRAGLWQGLYHWLADRPSLAWQEWKRGEAEAIRLGMTYERALLDLQQGRHAEGEERETRLAQALESLTTLGAVHDFGQGEGP